MFKLKGKAGEISEMISKICVDQGAGVALFSPQKVNVDVKGKKIDFQWIDIEHTAFVSGQARNLDLSGKSGEYVLDVDLASWITKLFGADESITINHHGSDVLLEGESYTAKYIPTDYDATRVEASTAITVEKGLPKLKGVKWSPIEISAEEIQSILSPTTLVYGAGDIKVVRLSFDKKTSLAVIGSLEGHTTGVSRRLKAKVKKGFNITLGQNFAEILHILDGDITLYGSGTTTPIWITQRTDNLTIGYLVAQYEEEEAAKDEGEDDSEVIDMEEDEE